MARNDFFAAQAFKSLNTDIKFKKQGFEISKSIRSQITQLEANQLEISSKLDEICKRREVTVDEVLQAHDDLEVAAYTSKASSSLGPDQGALPNSVIRALQNDLQTMRALSSTYHNNKAKMVDMKRVADNLTPEESYLLSYDELITFGF